MRVASVKPHNVCYRLRKSLLFLCKHKDYDNHLVKDNCWKETAGEVHAEGKNQATQYFVHYRKAYCWYAFVWYYSDNVTTLFILVEECKLTWARLRSYYRKALRRREPTSGKAARKFKKWRFEEQMRFLQNHFRERGWVVIKMIHLCKFNNSNTCNGLSQSLIMKTRSGISYCTRAPPYNLAVPTCSVWKVNFFSGDGWGSTNHISFYFYLFHLLILLLI